MLLGGKHTLYDNFELSFFISNQLLKYKNRENVNKNLSARFSWFYLIVNHWLNREKNNPIGKIIVACKVSAPTRIKWFIYVSLSGRKVAKSFCSIGLISMTQGQYKKLLQLETL